MAGEDARERALVLGLELIIELLADPLADLLGDRLHVQSRGHPLEQAHDHLQVLQVRAHRAGDPGVLHLHGHIAAIVEGRTVHLADRGSRDGLFGKGREHLLDRLFQIVLDHLPHLLERNGGRGIAQLCQLALELVAMLLRHQTDVQEGHHLAKLHRGSLHRPEHGHDLLGGLQLAPGHRLFGGRLGAGHVDGAGAELLHRLAGGERRDRGRAPHARAWDPLALARHW